MPVGDVCRQVGISEQTFYRWKKVYGGMLPSEARELKQLRDENTQAEAPRRRPVARTRSCCRTSFKKSSEARQAARGHAVLDGPLRRQHAARVSRDPRRRDRRCTTRAGRIR